MRRIQVKRKASLWETGLLVLIGVFSFSLASGFSGRGIAQKWATATLATLIIFGTVVYFARKRIARWPFWTAIGICFLCHSLLVWIVFHSVLSGTDRFSILFWYPIMLVEIVTLLIVENRIEKLLSQSPSA
jgi:peptidoglycan/LPS O-acetylase OafA/YrhL